MSVVDGMPAGLEPADPTSCEGMADDERERLLSYLPATIDEVFDTLERAADAERVEVSYDPELGFPVEARIDDDLLSVDDEFEFRASELEVR